jgi:hypothetical protein
VTSSSEERRARLRPDCGTDPYTLTYLYCVGDGWYAIEHRGEMSLVDGDNLKSLLRQLSGKDVLP